MKKIYNVKESDLKDSIKDIPIEIIQKMVDYQIKQGNEPNIKVFQKDKFSSKRSGGFDWDETDEGKEFWSSILNDKFYIKFYEIYDSLFCKIEHIVNSFESKLNEYTITTNNDNIIISKKQKIGKLPLNTFCLVSNDTLTWYYKYYVIENYVSNEKVFDESNINLEKWKYIIPYDKAKNEKDFLKHNINTE